MTKALGITDERTSCDCCGKSNLKCTVAMELDGGEIVYYGRTCASRNTGKTSRQINAEVRAEEARILAAASIAPAEIAALAGHALAAGPGVNLVGDAALELCSWKQNICQCKPAIDVDVV